MFSLNAYIEANYEQKTIVGKVSFFIFEKSIALF